MLIRPLPHPGFAWSFTQHAAGFDENTIRGMLSCALPFQGQEKVGPQITELMLNAGLLTANERDGKPDAWRDYQQILSELGLIVSTKLCPKLRLTDVARAFVAGELPFRQLMQMQVFRYQYPNGQKHDRSPALKAALEANGNLVPESLIDLHINSGVLIKPALLILQVLVGLLDSGEVAQITADECRAFLLPCKTNGSWDSAVKDIRTARSSGVDQSTLHAETKKRNIQDWFKLIELTGLFETDGKSYVALNQIGRSSVQELRVMCSQQTVPEAFWLPSGHSLENRRDWFRYFGGINAAYEELEPSSQVADVENNGISSRDDMLSDDKPTVTGPVRLVDFDSSKLFSRDAPDLSSSMKDLAQKVVDGAIKRHAKTVMHDQIVLRYAERFQSQGAEVKVDPNSVDLFVKWTPEQIAIFEVKTVTHRSLSGRMRLAVGQVKEYAYRLTDEIGFEPEQAIIIDRAVDASSWQRGFLNDYMKIGLICTGPPVEDFYAPSSYSTANRWAG